MALADARPGLPLCGATERDTHAHALQYEGYSAVVELAIEDAEAGDARIDRAGARMRAVKCSDRLGHHGVPMSAAAFWWVLLPSLVVGGLMAFERYGLRRGWVGVHRFGIPLGGWTEALGVDFPASLIAKRFPARDDLASGGIEHIRVRWLNDSVFAFWDDRSHGGLKGLASLMVLALVELDRTGGPAGTVLRVDRRLRLLPWTTLIVVYLLFVFVMGKSEPPTDLPWAFVAVVAVVLAISTMIAVGRLRPAFAVLSAALIERARTGEPWIGTDELESAGVVDRVDRF